MWEKSFKLGKILNHLLGYKDLSMWEKSFKVGKILNYLLG